jgi:hypothetical protein
VQMLNTCRFFCLADFGSIEEVNVGALWFSNVLNYDARVGNFLDPEISAFISLSRSRPFI